MKRGGRFLVIGFVVVAVLSAVGAYWIPRISEAVWFLQDIAAGPAPSTWKTVHPTPTLSKAEWTIDSRAGSGDLYTPAETIFGRMIFVPGLVDDVRADPRVKAFAETLARAGFVVLVPEMPAYKGLRAGPEDIVAVADAVQWLYSADLPNTPRTKVGIAALSYLSGPVFLAASRAPTNDQVGFVFSIGPYYSMTDLIRFVTTRKFRLNDSDPWSTEPPADYATWSFLRANAQGIDSPADTETLKRIADAKLADGNADVGALVAALGPPGRAIYDLMTNCDPDKVDALIAALPQELRTKLDALDLSKQDLSGFKADAMLVHGKDDPFIASVESQKLAAVLGSHAHLYILEEVTHVEVNRSGSIWDQLSMLFAGLRLLGYRH